MKIGIIILAAGSSSRLGEPKQLLKFEGETLLRRATQTALDSKNSLVTVVLGASAEDFKSEIAYLPLEIAIADDWANGMSASIRAGLQKSLEIAPDLSAVVLLLCDQPFVTTKTIARLIKKYEETKSPIVASKYNATIGVPALFAREMFDELLNLKSEAGAKFLIKKSEASRLAKIAAPEAAFDVDTLADYERMLKNLIA